MAMEVLNLKEQIRKYVVSKFISIKRLKLTTYDEEFLYEVNSMSPNKRNTFMASIVYDAYESLKWKTALEQFNVDEISLLEVLDESQCIDEAIEMALSVENIDTLLRSLYCSNDLLFIDKVNVKNNIRNVDVNHVIVDADILRHLDDFGFYEKGFIFDKSYNKEQYLTLYGSLLKECESVKATRKGFIEIISGIQYYNKNSYDKLILDMCAEFLFQKSVTGNYDECDYDEDYLIYLIKYADVNRIISVATDNDKAMSALAYSYESYPHFQGNIRKQIETEGPESEMQKVIKKLSKGK